MKYFGIIDENSFKGYSATVKSLLDDTENKEIIDINLENPEDKIIKALEKNTNNISIVSAADMGIKLFQDLLKNPKIKNLEKRIEFILSSDKFYDLDLSFLNKVSLLMPEEAISQYRNKHPKLLINSFPADLVSSISKDEIVKRAMDFKGFNPFVDKVVSNILNNNGKSFFVGGRVSLSNGSFKENTPEIFEKAAKTFVQDGNDGVIVFHGLRSFTKGDKTNDFEPINAFYKTIKKEMKDNQNIALLTKELDENGTRKSVFSIIQKENGTIFSSNYRMIDSDFAAADYYYLLNETVKRGLNLTATIEQMNFIPEALELGANKETLTPYKWDLSVESNILTYQKVFDGKDVKTQKQAFDSLVKQNKYKENLIFSSINQR